MIESESRHMAKQFQARIERVQVALRALRLSKYADEVAFVIPTSGPEFERFVYYTETLAATVAQWSTLVEVNVTHEPATIAEAKDATAHLATSARHVLNVYMGAR